jgi:hypothetical protein
MLDYAANAVRYWPPSELRATFEATALFEGTTGDERLREAVPGVEPDEFWEQVEENLKTGRIRMVFVADRLPAELVRIIEFLNEQMNPAEVLGVEVVQYVGDGQQVLVPRLVGRTSSAVAAKRSGRTTWDEENFLVAVADRHGDSVAAFFKRLFDHTRSRSGQLAWSSYVSGRHKLGGVPTVVWTADPGVASARARAYLSVYLPEIRNRVDADTFDVFVAGLEAIPAYQAKIAEARSAGFARKYPSLFVSDLESDPGQVNRFLEELDRLVAGSSSG